MAESHKVTQIRCDDQDAVRVLTIDNQPKRNAFSGDMVLALRDRLDEAGAMTRVRCVVITGAGDKAFSSGHDLTEVFAHGDEIFNPDANAGFVRPASMTKPTIAAVNGYAYAAGFILALSCDLRVASANATFYASGARVGLLPIGGQLSRLLHLMPHAKALEMIMTAELVSAEEAFDAGFLNRLVPEGEALSATMDLAHKIAVNSPAVVQEIKKGFDVTRRRGPDAGEAFEWETGKRLGEIQDAEEGVRAFLEGP